MKREVLETICNQGLSLKIGSQPCLIRLLKGSPQEQALKSYLLTTYYDLPQKEKKRMLQRFSEFILRSCVVAFNDGTECFGLIYYFPERLSPNIEDKTLKELSRIVEGLKRRRPYEGLLAYLFYGKRIFQPEAQEAEIIYTAIKKGVSPSLLVLVNGGGKKNGRR